MFHKLFISALFLLTTGYLACGQAISPDFFKFSTIPDSLKFDANSVVRYSETKIDIRGPGKAVVKFHSIVTILNDKADKDAVMQMGYNKKYDTYSDVEMRIYSDAGKMIKKYRKSDMYDGSAANDETMVTNERFLAVKHDIAAYPVTVEIEYEENISSFINLDSWHIQQHFGQAVQNATCIVTVDPLLALRYKNEHIDLQPAKASKDGLDVYTWAIKDLKAIKSEDYVAPWTVLPGVLLAVNSFNCYGYAGDFTNWQTFGKWIQRLNDGALTLSAEKISELQNLTNAFSTEKEKARFLYQYMQKSMRYVGIQLGIGGYKPFPATFVDAKKYGDCKALSNYMQALLKAVNINSYYALIRAGSNEKPIDPAFPYNAFNHAILCVPMKTDTVWLECTSSTHAFGKLGSFTENRQALLITEDGGKLVNTPRSTMQDNQFVSEVYVKLTESGEANAEVKIVGTGLYQEDYESLGMLKEDEQKQILMRMLNIKQPTYFNLATATNNDGAKEVKINLGYDKFFDMAVGNKQFYKPGVIDLNSMTLPISENRRNDFYLKSPMHKTCVTIINLPVGFEVEALPASTSLKFVYGSYDVSYEYNKDKNQVISTAKFALNNWVIPAGKYTEFQQYLDDITKAQNKKLVIKRKA
jgi:hypothetical protein